MGGQGGDKSIVFRIVPRGAIEGTIRDEFGDSMVRALVSVVRPVWRDGRPVMSNVARKSTDDRGRYRFGNLAPGNYVVCAEGDQNTQAPVQGPVDYTTRVDNRFYTRTCNRAFQLSRTARAGGSKPASRARPRRCAGTCETRRRRQDFRSICRPRPEAKAGAALAPLWMRPRAHTCSAVSHPDATG